MNLNNRDITYIIAKLQPKISNSLKQTNINYRDDLEQDLKEMIIKKLKSGTLNNNVPSFFEYIQQKKI